MLWACAGPDEMRLLRLSVVSFLAPCGQRQQRCGFNRKPKSKLYQKIALFASNEMQKGSPMFLSRESGRA